MGTEFKSNLIDSISVPIYDHYIRESEKISSHSAGNLRKQIAGSAKLLLALAVSLLSGRSPKTWKWFVCFRKIPKPVCLQFATSQQASSQ
jgi:hypothetical protein